MSFCDEVKGIRLKCLLSQSELAQKLGVSFSTINRWETGKTLPNYQKLKKIRSFCEKNNIDFNLDVMMWEANK